MEANKYPANVDEKNICTEWFSEIFDKGSIVKACNKCLGYIQDVPCELTWNESSNRIQIQILEHPVYNYKSIYEYLKNLFDSYNTEEYDHYNVIEPNYCDESAIYIAFYWRDEVIG